jgi:spoIIIJ-associated protein
MESIIQKALKILLDKFGAEYDCVRIEEMDGHYRANIETSDPSRLIGKGGETLNALQTLLKNMLYAQNKENIFVSVDVDHYRREKEDRVIAKAEKFIQIMQNENLGEIKLPPMSPYFRRIIHVWVLNNQPEMGSDSVGEEPKRAVRLFYK